MRKNAVAWILLIISAIIMYMFSNESITLAVLLALVAAPPVSYAVLRLSAKKLDFSIEEAGSIDGKMRFLLNMTNKGILPVAAAEAEVVCKNLRTGETDTSHISKSIGPRGKAEVSLDVMPGHAGRYELSIGNTRIGDPLGIWSKPADFSDSAGVTVMPDIFDINMVPAGVTAMPESDMEAHKTRGAVSGDMIDIREYVPGDPVSNIHWKLSEKTGKQLVKVLGSPVSDQYLIILANTPELADDSEALDAVASVYASLINTLRRSDMVFYAGWTDPVTGKAVIRRISDDSEAAAAADEYLAVPAANPGAFASISRDVAADRYAHVIIVGSRIPENIDAITNGCSATVLKYGESGSFTEGSLTVVGFEAETYAEDTAGIAI